MNHNHAEDSLKSTLLSIQTGDDQTRDCFLAEYQPFVAKVASTLCKRYLEWGRDDELSIALIAFNHAIDNYKAEKGVPFLPFSRLVIENRLKDYFKKEARHQHSSLYIAASEEGEQEFSPGEIEQAWTTYQNLTIEDERNQEIEELDKLLNAYGIQFDDLVDASPKHRDTRQTMIRAARNLAGEPVLMNYLKAKKMLPAKELSLATGIHRKTLEKGRKYIITLALIMDQPNEFLYLRTYINFDL